MFKIKRIWIIIILFIFFGCSSYIKISDIKNDPLFYNKKQVTVKGKVTETFAIPFINNGMYRITDDSDSIWVMSKNVPFRGDKVIVRGEVKTTLTIGNRSFGTVIVEN